MSGTRNPRHLATETHCSFPFHQTPSWSYCPRAFQCKQERAPSWPSNAKECVAAEAESGTNISRERECSAWDVSPIGGGILPPLSIITPQAPVSCVSHYNTPREPCEKEARWRQNKQSVLSPELKLPVAYLITMIICCDFPKPRNKSDLKCCYVTTVD